MPSTKKRINLTVPDEIYIRIKAYEEEHGVYNDASACLQLIVQQLNSLENSKKLFDFFGQMTPEQYSQAVESSKPDMAAFLQQLNQAK